MVVAHLGIFWQHAVLAAISGTFAVIASFGAVLLNRRMTRIEVQLNGRLDQLLGPLAASQPPRKRRRRGKR